MKRNAMIFGAGALLSGAALFGFTSPNKVADCPLKGTPECPPVQNCPDKGTAACTLAGVPSCCVKK